MTKFEAIKAITGIREFSALIFDILQEKDSPEDVASFLSEDLSEKQLQTLVSVAESGNYPLFLDGL